VAAEGDQRAGEKRDHGPSGEGEAEPIERPMRSDVDAIGLEKRRSVVGGAYGPSFGKQVTAYAAFFAVVGALVIGFFLLARELDQPPTNQAAEAPWAQPGAEQLAPRPLDFPRHGPTDVD
jgi:hypothetical protein